MYFSIASLVRFMSNEVSNFFGNNEVSVTDKGKKEESPEEQGAWCEKVEIAAGTEAENHITLPPLYPWEMPGGTAHGLHHLFMHL